MAIQVVSTRDALGALRRLVQDARSGKFSGLVIRCRNADEARTLLRLPLRPEFLLLDPEIPYDGEIELLKEVRKTRSPTKIVVMVPRLDSREALEIARLGPAAMISRDLPRHLLVEALQAILPANDERSANSTGESEPPPDRVALPIEGVPLTPREMQIGRLASKGMHDREIADCLHVTERTIKGHLHHIYRKLNVRGRNDLTRHCIKSGWA